VPTIPWSMTSGAPVAVLPAADAARRARYEDAARPRRGRLGRFAVNAV
jgi:hypothetical protein